MTHHVEVQHQLCVEKTQVRTISRAASVDLLLALNIAYTFENHCMVQWVQPISYFLDLYHHL